MRHLGRGSFFVRLGGRLHELLGRGSGDGGGRLYSRIERRFRDGTVGAVCGDGYDRRGWQFRARRYGMRCREESRLLAIAEQLSMWVGRSSIGYLGLLFLMTGISFLILTLILETLSSDPRQMLACVSLIFFSIPLLTSTRSIASLARDSLLVGWVQRAIGREPMPPPTERARGEARPMSVLLLLAVLVVTAGIFSPFLVVWGAMLFFLVLFLLFVPEVNIPLILFALPFFQLSSHPTHLLMLSVFLMLLSWLLKIYCGRRDFNISLADFFVLLFSLLLLLGGLVGYGDASVGCALSFLTFAYFPVKNLLSSRVWRERARLSLCVGAAASATVGIIQYFFSDLSPRWLDSERFFDIGGRVTSFFDNPNILAIYLVLSLPIALCAALDGRICGLRRFFFFVCTVLLLFCITLTWSRGAWLAAALSLLLSLLLEGRGSAVMLTTGIPVLLASLPFLPQNVIRRFLSIGDLAESSIRYRFYTWQGVFEMIRAHPFGIGVGERAFRRVYPAYAKSGIETVMHAHSLFLQVAGELGLVGLAVFLFLLSAALFKGLGRRTCMGAPYALCGAVVMGLFDHLWYAPSMIFMVFVMLSFSLIEEETR